MAAFVDMRAPGVRPGPPAGAPGSGSGSESDSMHVGAGMADGEAPRGDVREGADGGVCGDADVGLGTVMDARGFVDWLSAGGTAGNY